MDDKNTYSPLYTDRELERYTAKQLHIAGDTLLVRKSLEKDGSLRIDPWLQEENPPVLFRLSISELLNSRNAEGIAEELMNAANNERVKSQRILDHMVADTQDFDTPEDANAFEAEKAEFQAYINALDTVVNDPDTFIDTHIERYVPHLQRQFGNILVVGAYIKDDLVDMAKSTPSHPLMGELHISMYDLAHPERYDGLLTQLKPRIEESQADIRRLADDIARFGGEMDLDPFYADYINLCEWILEEPYQAFGWLNQEIQERGLDEDNIPNELLIIRKQALKDIGEMHPLFQAVLIESKTAIMALPSEQPDGESRHNISDLKHPVAYLLQKNPDLHQVVESLAQKAEKVEPVEGIRLLTRDRNLQERQGIVGEKQQQWSEQFAKRMEKGLADSMPKRKKMEKKQFQDVVHQRAYQDVGALFTRQPHKVGEPSQSDVITYILGHSGHLQHEVAHKADYYGSNTADNFAKRADWVAATQKDIRLAKATAEQFTKTPAGTNEFGDRPSTLLEILHVQFHRHMSASLYQNENKQAHEGIPVLTEFMFNVDSPLKKMGPEERDATMYVAFPNMWPLYHEFLDTLKQDMSSRKATQSHSAEHYRHVEALLTAVPSASRQAPREKH